VRSRRIFFKTAEHIEQLVSRSNHFLSPFFYNFFLVYLNLFLSLSAEKVNHFFDILLTDLILCDTRSVNRGEVMFDSFDRLFWQARLGVLPREFSDWEIMDITGVTVAHTVVGHGHRLPLDFDKWAMLDEHGRTVAHVAITTGAYPEGFAGWCEQGVWTLRNLAGWTVAHFAAHRGLLPDGFDMWGLENRGVTVAHTAAEAGNLPGGFEDWHMVDSEGRTVAEAHRQFREAQVRERHGAVYGLVAMAAIFITAVAF
jgi:hypothetical protein